MESPRTKQSVPRMMLDPLLGCVIVFGIVVGVDFINEEPSPPLVAWLVEHTLPLFWIKMVWGAAILGIGMWITERMGSRDSHRESELPQSDRHR